ncbi:MULTISPECIES: hypothetical protein [Stenotrophomonas]|uniref:hypothetical protein n=1 Tax=Stenotrophomonas TaxID=40323 RepID=UPI00168B4C6B|nr:MULTISPECIES: hypothetical protein [Stenotrophomonas]MBD3680470.1 hypothetical protein [Stenotrophomonas sp. Br8]
MQLKTDHEIYGHSFDALTGLYVLPIRIYPEADGSCPLPNNTVDFPPVEQAGAHQAWRINAERTAWETVADFRGVMLWDKNTGVPAPNQLALGELPPPSVTIQRPQPIEPGEPLANRWNDALDAWELVPDYTQTPIWDKATGFYLPQLAVGEPLPATATALAPPRDHTGPWRYSETQGGWESVPTPEPIEPAPVPPESATDPAAG